jgi:multidrug resistance protein
MPGAFVPLFLAVTTAMLGLGIIAPIMPLYVRDFGASGIELGLVLAAFSVSRLVLGPLNGRLSDRLDRKRLIVGGLGLYALVSLAYVVAHSLWQVALLRLLQGAASTLVTPIAQAYVGDRTEPGREGRTMNLFYTSVFLGMGLGPLLGGHLAEQFGLRAPFYAMTLLAVVALAGVALFVPPDRPALRPTPAGARSWRELAHSADVWGIVVYMATRGFWRQAFNAFWPLIAADHGLGEGMIGTVLTLYFVGESLLQLPAGFLADRMPRRPQVVLGGVLAASPLLVVPLVRNPAILLSLSFVMGAASALGRGSIIALRTELGRTHGMGTLAGVQESAFSAGQALGPTAAGAMYTLAGLDAPMYFSGALGLVGTVAAALILSPHPASPKTVETGSRSRR